MFPIRDHNPSRRVPYITYTLIAANIAIWLWGLAAVQTDRQMFDLYMGYAMIPARLSSGDGYLSLVTSAFLHAGFWHLAGNMLFLWIFGDNLEDEMGHIGFALFYLLAGIAAGIGQWASEPWSPVPMVGASGAIAGVMGAYLLFFPRAKVDVLFIFIIFFRIFPIPAWIVLGVWFALQVNGGFGVQPGSGGVAYWAHAGGFIAGVVLALPAWLRHGGPQFWRRTDGLPPHPEARYPASVSSVPVVTRRR